MYPHTIVRSLKLFLVRVQFSVSVLNILESLNVTTINHVFMKMLPKYLVTNWLPLNFKDSFTVINSSYLQTVSWALILYWSTTTIANVMIEPTLSKSVITRTVFYCLWVFNTLFCSIVLKSVLVSKLVSFFNANNCLSLITNYVNVLA